MSGNSPKFLATGPNDVTYLVHSITVICNIIAKYYNSHHNAIVFKSDESK